jgi:hypothetical protein
MIYKQLLTCWLVLALNTRGAGRHSENPKQDLNGAAPREIHLRDLGYQPSLECPYAGTGIPRDLSILNDDYKERLTFIDDKTLVVYQSHCRPQNKQDTLPEQRSMEALFVSPQAGVLISRRTWPTIKRRWLNERWDTQARIFAVRGGFLVHAGNSLIVYSAEQEQKATLALEDGPAWAVTVAPVGRTIHLQRIHTDNQAKGEWLASDSLEKLRRQDEMAGIISASDQAVVGKTAHCVQLQVVGERPRSLYCADPSRLGLPLFLTDLEVLSVFSKGFTVFSASGERRWSREVPEGRLVGNHKRALNGNRFGISTRGQVVFDQVSVPKGQLAIIVYDEAKRTQILHVLLDRDPEQVDFELSPDGGMLAVLVGDTIRLYRIPA